MKKVLSFLALIVLSLSLFSTVYSLNSRIRACYRKVDRRYRRDLRRCRRYRTKRFKTACRRSASRKFIRGRKRCRRRYRRR